MRQVLSGNGAAAWGFRLSRVQCYPYYPITPSTACSQQIAKWVNDGELDTVTVNVESEHSAATEIITAGKSVRAGSATSSKGLLYMIEVLENGAGAAVPFTLFVGNRATGAPINIWGDHSDAYAARDSGIIQLFAADAQEALDGVIQAYRIAEDLRVRLPVSVNLRGFTGTHTYEGMEIPPQQQVDVFLPPYLPLFPLFARETPVTYGAMLSAVPYRRHKRNQAASLRQAISVTEEVGKAFGEAFGRSYGLYEWIGDEHAPLVVALLGESAGSGEVVVNHLRGQQGVPGVALLKIRLFSPFPGVQIAEALRRAGTKAVVVFEEGLQHGAVLPPLAQRLATACHLYLGRQSPKIASVIGGLGGSEVNRTHFQLMFNLADNMASGRPYRHEPYWLDIDEDPIFVSEERQIDPKLWQLYGEIWRKQRRKACYYTPIPQDTQEIRLYGRAGQGAITSAVQFTAAATDGGLQVLTKPTFGSERRGAVVTTDTMVGEVGGRKLRCFSGLLEMVGVYDDTILQSPQHDITAGLKPGGTILINTSRFSPQRIRELLQLNEQNARIFVVPASDVARELGLGHFFNMVMLGAMHRVYPRLDFDRALTYYAHRLPQPRELNLQAIRRGFEATSDRLLRPVAKAVEEPHLEALLEWRPQDPCLELEELSLLSD